MSGIEEVKNRLKRRRLHSNLNYSEELSESQVSDLAQQNNQLYEPWPDQATVCPNCKGTKWVGYEGGFGDDCPMCKGKGKLPNQSSRLLTDREALVALNKYPTHRGERVELRHPVQEYIRIIEAQDTKTASIKDEVDRKDDARIEALIESVIRYLDDKLGFDYSGIRTKEIKALKANPTSEVEG